MRTYYFDLKDGVPVRDKGGLEFPTVSAAIEHSKNLAAKLRDDPRPRDPTLAVVVIDESGTQIHREPVFPEKPGLSMSFSRIG
jgi:hypothetical protein